MFIYTLNFILQIFFWKIIKIKSRVKNESTIALFEGKLLSTTESIINMQLYMTKPPWAVVALETVKGVDYPNLGILGKIYLFTDNGWAFQYLLLEKKYVSMTKIVHKACIFMSKFIGCLGRNGQKNAD